MSKNKNISASDGFDAVEGALTKTEVYIEENRKSLTIIILAIAIVVGGYLSYQKFYVGNKEDAAVKEIFMAERFFKQDSFNLALNGNGQYLGLLEIIEDYSVTKTANLAHFYAGISYLRLGDFESAIEHLEKFDGDDRVVASVALGALGDAHVELGQYKEGVSYYEKAAEITPNEFSSPIFLMKAGLVYEELQDYKKALDSYEKIALSYPNSQEATQVEKYITVVKMKM